MSDVIPLVDLKAQAAALHDEYEAAFWSVVERAAYTMGPELQEFEAAFAAFCDVEHCVGVSSGTDAVKLALLGAGVRPGDEVAVPANTFIATAEAVSHVGAVPVFVDCDESTALLDPQALAALCEERAGALRAVIPVHLYGQPCGMDAIQEIANAHGLAVVEDACQAHGASYKGKPCGSFGVTAAFSFYPGKNLGSLGDGGAVVTADGEIAERLRLLRNHGQAGKFTHALVGYCDRLHNLQAAILLAKLDRLSSWNQARRAAARAYDARLAGVSGVTPISLGPDVQPVYHLYVVRTNCPGGDRCGRQERAAFRDAVRVGLDAAGVQTGIHYAVPVHLQPAYAHLGYRCGDLPVSELLADEILSLPMFPEITETQIARVVQALVASLNGAAR